MAIQRLHAFEKTSIQARHAIKRLEVVADITKDESERRIARQLLGLFQDIRNAIPNEYQDTDINP